MTNSTELEMIESGKAEFENCSIGFTRASPIFQQVERLIAEVNAKQ